MLVQVYLLSRMNVSVTGNSYYLIIFIQTRILPGCSSAALVPLNVFSSATRQMERVENLLHNVDRLHTSASTYRFHTEHLGSVSLKGGRPPIHICSSEYTCYQEAMQPFTSEILRCPFKNLLNPSVAGLRLHLRARWQSTFCWTLLWKMKQQ